MQYRARTLTGRLALYFGVTKAKVRDVFLVAGVGIAVIAGLLFTLG
jgi:hypothetical protein